MTDKCEECEGEGTIYIDTSPSCQVRMNDCCGGCGYDATCETCDGTGDCPHEDGLQEINMNGADVMVECGCEVRSQILKPGKPKQGDVRPQIQEFKWNTITKAK